MAEILTARAACSCLPLRRGPQLWAELMSQLLFGEAVDVLEEDGIWNRVRCHHDGYEGWVDSRQLRRMEVARDEDCPMVGDLMATARSETKTLHMPLGARLPGFHNGRFQMGGEIFQYEGSLAASRTEDLSGQICQQGLRLLDCPYMWGGRTFMGVDCSGLSQLSFALCGVQLPRDSREQAMEGKSVGGLNESRPSDLAFFGPSPNEIRHVGILLPEGKILHASSRVRIDFLTEEGIVHASTGELTHAFLEIRRVIA